MTTAASALTLKSRAKHRARYNAYMRAYQRRYRRLHPPTQEQRERALAKAGVYRAANSERICEQQRVHKREWRAAHLVESRARARAWKLAHPGAFMDWERRNREYRRAYQRARRKRLTVRLAFLLRRRIWIALRGKRRPGSAVRDLGCSIQDLRAHLEAEFLPGMTQFISQIFSRFRARTT